jgi:hypothetical protein
LIVPALFVHKQGWQCKNRYIFGLDRWVRISYNSGRLSDMQGDEKCGKVGTYLITLEDSVFLIFEQSDHKTNKSGGITMSKKTHLSVVAALLLSWFGSPLEAGLISSPVNKPSDLDRSGDVKYAINFGNNGAITVGGTFTFRQDQDYPSVSLIATGEMVIPSWFGVLPSTGYPNLDLLLGSGAYTNNGPGSCTTSISLGQMQIGTAYTLQLIFYESTGHSRPQNIVVENKMIIDTVASIQSHFLSCFPYFTVSARM